MNMIMIRWTSGWTCNRFHIVFDSLTAIQPTSQPLEFYRKHSSLLPPCSNRQEKLSWRTVTFVYTFKKSGQPGALTRLTACDTLNEPPGRDIVNTFVAKSIRRNAHDEFTPYDRPGMVSQWLAATDVKEDYILLLDEGKHRFVQRTFTHILSPCPERVTFSPRAPYSQRPDVVLRTPILPTDLGAEVGRPVSAGKFFLRSLTGTFAKRLLGGGAKPRLNFRGGEYGRYADQVGGFLLIHREDLKRVAPSWLEYTERVKNDPVGDENDPNWAQTKVLAADVYGYALAAAKVGLEHTVSAYAFNVMYGNYEPRAQPKALHYSVFDTPFTGLDIKAPFFRSVITRICIHTRALYCTLSLTQTILLTLFCTSFPPAVTRNSIPSSASGPSTLMTRHRAPCSYPGLRC